MNGLSLSDVDIDTYRRDGVLVVRDLLSPEEVEVARAGIAAVLGVIVTGALGALWVGLQEYMHRRP